MRLVFAIVKQEWTLYHGKASLCVLALQSYHIFHTRIIPIFIILTAPRYTGQHAVFGLAVYRAQGSQERHLLGLYALHERGLFVWG